MKKSTKTYILSIVLTLAVGVIAALLTRNNMDVYENIRKPFLAPPGIVFPIVWTILYILMGISFAIVLQKSAKEGIYALPAILIYILQLAVNFLWSIIFFNLEAYLFSFIWLLVLWVLVGAMIIKFYEISPLAAYLNIPYFVWVTFAGYLNFMIYALNA